MPVGRLFTEIGKEVDRMNASLRQAVETAKEAGIKVTGAGQSIISRFDEALNPTKKLAEQIELLTKAGKSNADVWTVMGNQIKSAADAARANGQEIDATVKKLLDMGAGSKTAGIGIEGLSTKLTEFVRNPVAATKAALLGVIETLGPMGIAIGAVGTAAAVAGTAFFKFAETAAADAEKLENLSAQTGLSVQQLEALRRIAEETGIEGMDLGRTIGKIQDELGKPGASEFKKSMDLLGISAVTASGKTKGAVQVLDEMRVSLQAIEDPNQRAQLAWQVLGDRLRGLIPLITQGRAGIGEMTAELIDQGAVVSDLAHNRLLAFDEKLDLTGRSVLEAKNRFIEMTAAIVDWAEGIAQANPKLNVLGMALAKIIGGSFGMNAYNIIVGNSAEQARELTDAEKDLHNWMLQNQGLIEGTIAKTGELNEKTKKVKETYMGWGITVEAATGRLGAMQYEIDRVNNALKEMDRITKVITSEGMAELNKEIAESGKGLTDFSTNARGAGEEWKAMGLDLSVSYTPALHTATESTGRFADVLKNQVSTIFTDLSRKLADNILEWKGWGNTIVSTIKAFAEAALRILIESLLTPLMTVLQNAMGAIINLFSGKGAGGFSLSSLFGGLIGNRSMAATGLGALTTLFGVGGTAGTAAALTGASTAAFGTTAMTGGTIGSLLIPSMGGAPVGGAAGGTVAAGGSGFLGTMGALFTNPVTIGVGAALGAAYLAYKAFTQDAYEAGQKEVLRDLNLQISQGNWKTFTKGLGLTEKQLYPIRLDVEMSPKFLTEVAWPLAVQQGKIDEFLASLQEVETVMGTVDLATPFQEFLETGSVDALNEAYTDLFEHSQALIAIMPDFATKLGALADSARQAAYGLKLEANSFEALKASIQELIPAAKDIYQTFLETGEITEELAGEITRFGGDIQKFQALADLNTLNSQFSMLVAHFQETGEILPELGDIITRFGGDLAIVQSAASQLQILQQALSDIGTLVQGLNQILPEQSAIQQILSGAWGPETWGNLASMGFDPAKLTKITDLVKFETGWESAVSQFQQSGQMPMGGILEQALWQFGGEAGATALERYQQGFNTLTPALLDLTKSAMDAAYQAERATVLDYLAGLTESTTEAINAAQTTINQQLDLVQQGITAAVQQAATDVIAEIDKILAAIQDQIENPQGAQPNIPGPETGGETVPVLPPGDEHFGSNVYIKGETIAPTDRRSGTTIIIEGPIYGFDDFAARVRQAGIQLQSRGDPLFARA